ncbi:putative transcription factor interactor and regulator CCHC(Zn) family [Helianthus annuus]|nr:putative transcription factor interactor and regulator CCHC(Zn) family [Helianthus annuus]
MRENRVQILRGPSGKRQRLKKNNYSEEPKKNEVPKKIEKRTCFRCKIAGHVAKDCPKTFKPKQEISGKMKEKIVEKTELSTWKFTGFENSTFEKGECSKSASRRKDNVLNQKWVVKGSGLAGTPRFVSEE